jgi:hypothetical protein
MFPVVIFMHNWPQWGEEAEDEEEEEEDTEVGEEEELEAEAGPSRACTGQWGGGVMVQAIYQHHFQNVIWPFGIFTNTGMVEAHFWEQP